jgi:hypothetical protein
MIYSPPAVPLPVTALSEAGCGIGVAVSIAWVLKLLPDMIASLGRIMT